MKQLHKRFEDEQVKALLERYINGEIKRRYIQEILGVSKAQFFRLLQQYQTNKETFTIVYKRKKASRTIDAKIEPNIVKELLIDKKLIENEKTPVWAYNYSYIKDRLEKKYKQKVSVPTIIDRAKKHDCYLKKRQRKTHDREVLTNYIGELIQHDASQHLFAPDAEKKWYLLTSLDDYSRCLLYARILERESAWAHIQGLQTVFVTYGLPITYYVDNHSIFRFVRGRDELHYKHHVQTDEATPQWKHVLNECQVKITYALSPQAKGKIERPYRWLQDHLVRTCVREGIRDIKRAQGILNQEVKEYNYKRIHSTTGEVPYIRFQEALKAKRSLFRDFRIPKPFVSSKDIFCFRVQKRADAYRRISINKIAYKIKGLNPYDKVELRIYPKNRLYSEVRFWRYPELVAVQRIKNTDLKGVSF